MRKILFALFLSILLIATVSAMEWDNIKSYDEQTKTVVIKNALGFGEDIVKAKLLTPHYNIVPVGKHQKIAEINITKYSDYQDLIKGMKLYDIKQNNKSIQRSYSIEVLTTVTETVPTYSYTCEGGCRETQSGTTTRTYEKSEPLTQQNFVNGDETTIGIFMDMGKGDVIEWIPTIAGRDINEWAITASDSFLYAYYPLNATGTNVVGGNNNLVISTATTNSTTTKQGGSIQFDGSNDYIRNTSAVLSAGEKTVNVWFYYTALTGGGTENAILSAGAGNGVWNMEVIDDATNTIFFYNDGSGVAQAGTTTFNQWYMFTLVQFANGTVTGYLNGTSVFTDTGSTTTAKTSMTWGARGDIGDRFWTGNLDEIGIWNRTLDVTEVGELYASGAGFFYPFVNPTSISAVTITSPAANNTNYIDVSNKYFNATATPDAGTAVNATLYIYSGVGALIGTNFTTSVANNKTNFSIPQLPLGTYLMNIQMCGNDAVCLFGTNNLTWNVVNDLNVTLNIPANSSNYTTNSVTFNATATDALGVLNLTLIIDGRDNQTITGGVGQNLSFQLTKQLAKGYHNWSARADDGSGTPITTAIRTFNISSNYVITQNTPTAYYNTTSNSIVFNASAVGGVTGIGYNFTLVMDGKDNQTFLSTAGENISFQVTKSVPDGSHNWSVRLDDGSGIDSPKSSGVGNYSVDTTIPIVGGSSPANASYINPTNQTHAQIPLTITATDTNLDKVWWNSTWDSSIHYVTSGDANIINTTNVFGNHIIYRYANDTLGNSAMNSTTIIIPKVSYSSTSIILNSETFSLNSSYFNGLTLSAAAFNYNGTAYSPSVTTDAGGNTILSNTFNIPLNNGTVFFYWNTTLSNNTVLSSRIYNHTVSTISIDDCSVNRNLILNFTNYDQDSKITQLFNNTFNVQVRIGDNNLANYLQYANNATSATNLAVCIDLNLTTNYRMDVIMQSNKNSSYFTQFYNIQNYTLSNSTMWQNITLYDLTTATGQTFQINIKDANYLPLQGAIVQIDRQYVQNGAFTTVEIPITDSLGNTIGHFVLNNQLYNIYIKKNGKSIASFLNQQVYCNPLLTDCTLNYNLAGSTSNPTTLDGNNNIRYNQVYDDGSRTFSVPFTSVDGTAISVNVTGILVDNKVAKTTVCSGLVTASSGTTTCIVPAAYANSTVLMSLYSGGTVISSNNVQVGYTEPQSRLHSARYLLAGLLIPLLVLMAGSSAALAGILFVVGLIMAVGLMLIDTQSYIGAGSFIIFFIIAAALLLWKITKGGAKNG